ncbi:MAG: hypothetical protein LPK19_13335, partial [Hymenobacteraceae bacterium]|nr:hypothetical protein [Hymenobacteraceae bacterium]MDX5397211.1 hypothetical protein [Hymenobacteraceae bacterium]MDX5513287.1 hypothetical protein [Hymenobacteraceae bacterium]
MTFRSRITLYFSMLTAVVLIFMGITVYVLAREYTQQEFFRRLYDRGTLTAQLHLESDELSASSINIV